MCIWSLLSDDKHEDVIVEYGQEVTLECSTVDKKFDYVEWFRNDSSYPVIQKLEDYSALVSTNFTSRAELVEKNLRLKHVKFEDAAVYVCRTAVRHGEENVSVQHGTFWKLIVKHEGESYKESCCPLGVLGIKRCFA